MLKTIKGLQYLTFTLLVVSPFAQLTAASDGDADARNEIDLYDRNRLNLDFSPYDYPKEGDENNTNNPTWNDIHPGDAGYYYNPYESNRQNSPNNNGNARVNQNGKNPRSSNLQADLYDRNRNQLDFSPYDYPSRRTDNNNYRNPTRSDIHPGDQGYYYDSSGYYDQGSGYYNQDNSYYYPNR